MHRLLASVLLIALLLLIGCQPKQASVVEPPPDNTEINVRVVNRQQYDEAIAKYRGKVVLVDFWATWCTECLEKFPHTVEISQTYPRDSLALVSLSFDNPDIQEAVAEYLTTQQADFEHLLVESGPGTKSMKDFEVEGGFPWYVLYDKQGNIAYRFSEYPTKQGGAEPVDQIEIRIRELLQK